MDYTIYSRVYRSERNITGLQWILEPPYRSCNRNTTRITPFAYTLPFLCKQLAQLLRGRGNAGDRLYWWHKPNYIRANSRRELQNTKESPWHLYRMGKTIWSPILTKEIPTNLFHKKMQPICKSLAYNQYLRLWRSTSLRPKGIRSMGRQ